MDNQIKTPVIATNNDERKNQGSNQLQKYGISPTFPNGAAQPELSKIFVSLFANAQITDNPLHITLYDLLRCIKDGTYAQQVNNARVLRKSDKKQYDDFKKKNVAGFTLSAYCKHRKSDEKATESEKADKLIKHTGLLQIDIDNIGKDDLPEVRRKIESDKHTLFSFESLSGEGLKAGIFIDSTKHKESFLQAERYYKETYDLTIDKSVKDVYRLCFVSHDTGLFVNPQAEIFTVPTNRQDAVKPPETTNRLHNIAANDRASKYAQQALKTAKSILNESVIGNRHSARLRAGELLGGYVAGDFFSKEYAMTEITTTVERNTDLPIEKAMKDVKDGIENGTKTPITYEDLEAERKEYTRNKGRYQHTTETQSINPDTGEITEADIPYVFWYEEIKEDKTLLKISNVQLYEFLKGIGIRVMELSDTDNRFVQIKKKVVSEIVTAKILNLLNKYIEELPEKISENKTKVDLREVLTKGINTYVNESKAYLNLPFDEIHFLQDTKDKAYFFFRNGFVEVSKNGLELKPYDDLHGFIWKSQIIDCDFTVITDSEKDKIRDFDFAKWSKHICSIREPYHFDEPRYKTLVCTIGYMLHNFKTSSNKFAVILTEANVDSEPQGRTGKGLLLQAISKIRKVTTIDGKNFSFDSQFAFQTVELDTQILSFDDVKRNFDFQRLFSAITEGLSVEKKNKARFNLRPEESPKIAISSNYAIQGNSESDKGRKKEMELLCYYNASYTPEVEFGGRFFDNWDTDQWNTFYNFMLVCVQTYLINDCKIPEYKSDTIAEKKLLISTNADFIEYADTLSRNENLSVDDTYTAFLEFSGKDNKEVSKPQFTKWVKIYCEYRNLKYSKEIRRNGNKTERYHHLKGQKTPS